jgi:HK97 family phage portal protein
MGAETAGAHFFNNMMRPAATLSHPSTLSDEAFKRLQQSVKNQAGGAKKTGGLMILEEGLSMDQWTIPPNDAQFLETRTFQVQDIARIFNIPPHKLAELSHATFSNVEEQERQYVGDCLQPWLENWEQELEYKLFLPEEHGEYQIRFNVDVLLRGNTQARGEFYSKLFNIGVYNQNEIRTFENMPTIGEAGNSYYIPVNLQNSEKAAAGDMSKESALAVIKIAFPNISESEIAQLTSGMEKIPAKTTPQEVD